MYSMLGSFLSVVGSTLHLLVVAVACTVLTAIGCVKQNRLTKLMKVVISYWTVWICMAVVTMFSDRLLLPVGIYPSISRYLREHTVIAGILSILSSLGWLYIASMPWVILTWLIIRKEHGLKMRHPKSK